MSSGGVTLENRSSSIAAGFTFPGSIGTWAMRQPAIVS